MTPISEFSKSGEICAVGIGNESNGNVHCGLLYKIEDKCYFLHLGDPVHLYNEEEFDTSFGYSKTKAQYKWKPFINVPDSLKKFLISHCSEVARRNKDLGSVSYGLLTSESAYFDQSGEFKKDNLSTGLTCATFVMVMLRDSSIQIIDADGWDDDRERDVDWLEKSIKAYENILAIFRKNLDEIKKILKSEKNAVTIALLNNERDKTAKKITAFQTVVSEMKGATKYTFVRFRPEEVGGVSYHDFELMPVKFKYVPPSTLLGAEWLGEALLKQL